MYQAPEVTHLVRAVDAVKRAIKVQKQKEPDDEPDDDIESDDQENEPKPK